MSLNNTTNETSTHLCECGCGKFTKFATKTSKQSGWIKGQPLRFLHGHRSPHPVENRFWSKVDKSGDCWLWTGYRMSDGYGTIDIDNRMVLTHRYSYELHNGSIPNGMCVCHTCDNPACVNPAHLWLGTHTDNMRDMVRKGRRNMVRGRAKLTESQVTEMRRKHARGGITYVTLSVEYGIDRTTVGNLIRRETWTDIP